MGGMKFDAREASKALDLVCDYADMAECRYGETAQKKDDAISFVRSEIIGEIERHAKRIAELEAIFLDLREFLLKRKLVDSDQLDGCVAIAHAVKDAILNLTSEESELVSTFEQRSPGRYRYLENKVRILDQIYKDDCSEMRKLHAALKKLGKAKRDRGKALVEERISGEFSDWIENQCPHWDIDEEPFCAELDGPCEYHEGECPISMELHRIARQQLRREGVL